MGGALGEPEKRYQLAVCVNPASAQQDGIFTPGSFKGANGIGASAMESLIIKYIWSLVHVFHSQAVSEKKSCAI